MGPSWTFFSVGSKAANVFSVTAIESERPSGLLRDMYSPSSCCWILPQRLFPFCIKSLISVVLTPVVAFIQARKLI